MRHTDIMCFQRLNIPSLTLLDIEPRSQCTDIIKMRRPLRPDDTKWISQQYPDDK